MEPLGTGATAPPITGADLDGPDPVALFFYKVTCPTCQMVAPIAQRLAERQGERFVAVAQDPPEKVEDFSRRFETTFDSVGDLDPYPVSDAYGIRTVPTLFAVRSGEIVDVVESWDRDGWNRVAGVLGLGGISHPGDGLPPFRPG